MEVFSLALSDFWITLQPTLKMYLCIDGDDDDGCLKCCVYVKTCLTSALCYVNLRVTRVVFELQKKRYSANNVDRI